MTRAHPAGEEQAGEPLARLFAIAYRQLIDDLHHRLRAEGWDDVRPAFGFALLAARTGTTAGELGALMGTTKQAASKLAATMLDAGYLAHGTAADDRRQRPLVLSARGRELLATVERIYAELEQGWADVIGASAVARLRREVTAAVSSGHDGRLPPVRPTP